MYKYTWIGGWNSILNWILPPRTPRKGNTSVAKRCKSLNEAQKNAFPNHKQTPCVGSDDLFFNDYENKICGLTVKRRRKAETDTIRSYNDRGHETKQKGDEPNKPSADATKGKKKVSFEFPDGNKSESSTTTTDKQHRKNFFTKRTNEECCKSIKEYSTRTESESAFDNSQPGKVSITERYGFITQALERMRTDLVNIALFCFSKIDLK